MAGNKRRKNSNTRRGRRAGPIAKNVNANKPRRSNRNAGSGKKGNAIRSPGSNVVSYSKTSPAVPGASGAWFKSLFDPAHCRSYGCVGIPDENRDPTAVLSGRADLVISNTALVPEGVDSVIIPGAQAELAEKNAEYVPIRRTGDGTDKFHRPYFSTFTISQAEISQITFYQSAHFGLIYRIAGKINVEYQFQYWTNVSGKDTWVASTKTSGPVSYMLCTLSSYIDDMVTGDGNMVRPISSSITLENVTAWSNVGGYFIGGHVPYRKWNDFISLSLDLSNYATFTSGAAAGVYTISRPRNLDAMCWFAPVTAKSFVYNFAANSLQTDVSLGRYVELPWIGTPETAWDVAWAIYYPTGSTWTLRATTYENVEMQRSYQQGGADGARLDQNTLRLAMATLDTSSFIFPASANDMKKVGNWLRKTIYKYRKPITDAMGVAGAPGWVTAVAKSALQHFGDD